MCRITINLLHDIVKLSFEQPEDALPSKCDAPPNPYSCEFAIKYASTLFFFVDLTLTQLIGIK